MKFIETITIHENSALVPIDRIKVINFGCYEHGYEIIIVSDDGEWSECFGDDDEKGQKRYDQLKQIINAY